LPVCGGKAMPQADRAGKRLQETCDCGETRALRPIDLKLTRGTDTSNNVARTVARIEDRYGRARL
jgi:hypothetical protein